MKGPEGSKVRQALAVFVVLALIIGIIALFNSTGGGTSGFTEPSADRLAEVLEVEQIPGSFKRDVPSALEDRFDEEFPAPVVGPGSIRSGGPPPDGIPAINRPFFETVEQVDWLRENEPVIVLELTDADGVVDARAYPVQILTWHEIVNDTVAGTPVTISYCPLCNSAIAYVRQATIDGVDAVLDFGTSGALLNSSLVMYDRQTESLWSHFTAQAIVGMLAGQQLEVLATTTTSWAEFVRAYPGGLVLSQTTGYDRSYGRNPYPGYDDAGTSPFLYEGVVDGRLLAKQRVLLLRDDAGSIVISLDVLSKERVVGLELDDKPIVALHAPGTASSLDTRTLADGADVGSTGVFSRRLAGELLTFEIDPGDETLFMSGDGSRWSILGLAVSGPQAGAHLEMIEHVDTFWFAVAAFDSEARIFTP